jgi:cysteine-rich repeat protein
MRVFFIILSLMLLFSCFPGRITPGTDDTAVSDGETSGDVDLSGSKCKGTYPNGIIESNEGEQCDDGNLNPNDFCNLCTVSKAKYKGGEWPVVIPFASQFVMGFAFKLGLTFGGFLFDLVGKKILNYESITVDDNTKLVNLADPAAMTFGENKIAFTWTDTTAEDATKIYYRVMKYSGDALEPVTKILYVDDSKSKIQANTVITRINSAPTGEKEQTKFKDFLVAWDGFSTGLETKIKKKIYVRLFKNKNNFVPDSSVFVISDLNLVNDFQNPVMDSFNESIFVVGWESCVLAKSCSINGASYKLENETLKTMLDPVALSGKEMGFSYTNPTASVASGRAFTAWERLDQSKNKSDIYGQIFKMDVNSGSLSPLTSQPFKINKTDDGKHSNPEITAIGNEVFVIIWKYQKDNKAKILAHAITLDGNEVAAETEIDSEAVDDLQMLSITGSPVDKFFLSVWYEDNGDFHGVAAKFLSLNLLK